MAKTKIMKKILDKIARHPFIVLGALVLIAGFFAWQVPGLTFNFSPGFEDDPEWQAKTDAGQELFGVVVVTSQRGDMFTPEALTLLAGLTSEIKEIEGVAAVESLSTVTHITRGKGFVRVEKLMNPARLDDETVARLREDVFQDDLWRKDLISEDGKSAAINVYVKPTPGPSQEAGVLSSETSPPAPLRRRGETPSPSGRVGEGFWGELNSPASQEGIVGAFETIISSAPSAEYDIYQIGMPLVRMAGNDLFRKRLLLFLPVVVLLISGILFVSFRTVVGAAFALLTMGLNLLVTLGFMAFMGYPVTSCSLVVLLLVLALACTRSWRMLLTCLDEIREGRDAPDALAHTLRHDGFPLFIASATLAFGLAIFVLSRFPGLRQFGATAAFSIIANFVITLLMFSGVGRILPRIAAKQPPEKPLLLFTLSAKITALHDQYRLPTLAGMLLLLMVTCAGIFHIRIDTPFFPLLEKDSPLMQRLSQVNEELAGVATLHISIDAGQAERIKEPDILKQIDELQQFLQEDTRVHATESLLTYLKILHREMNGGRQDIYAIPGSRALISQYLLLLKDTELHRYVSPDYAVAHLVVRHQLSTHRALLQAAADIRQYVNAHFSKDLTVSVASRELAEAEAAALLLKEHALYPVLVLLLALLLLSLAFLSVKVGFAALLPSMLSMLFSFGMTGWLHVPFNVHSSLLAALAFSLSLSHIISFLVRYHERLMLANDQELAVSTTIYHEGEPVFITSLALIAGFGLLVFSGVPALAQAGLLSILMIVFVLLAVFFLNPRILDAVRPITVWDFVQVNLDQAVIHTSPIFRGLRRSQIKRVVLLGSIRQAAKDEEIIRQGEEGHEMYMVLAGKVDIFLTVDGHKQTIHTVECGGIVGEMALYGEHIRSANVVALEETRLLRIDEKSLARVKKSYPRIAAQLFFNISALLSDRLREQMQPKGNRTEPTF